MTLAFLFLNFFIGKIKVTTVRLTPVTSNKNLFKLTQALKGNDKDNGLPLGTQEQESS